MNKVSIGLSLLAAASVGTSLYFFNELQKERDANAQLTAQLAARTHRRETRAEFVERTPAQTASTTPSGMAPRPAGGNSAPIDGAMGNRFNPRMGGGPMPRTMSKQELKLRLMQAYPDLAATLHLSPAEADKMFDVLAEFQTKQQEQRDALRDKGLSREEFASAMREQNAATKRERDQQIAATLGGDKAKQWQDYESTLTSRTQIRELGTILESSGYPLRDDQVQTLVNALAPEQARFRAEQQSDSGSRQNFSEMDQTQRFAMFEENLARTEKHNQATRDILSTYLTADQLKRYDEMSAQQLESQRANLQRARDGRQNYEQVRRQR